MSAPNDMTAVAIRPAAEVDLAAINDIYNHYVLHSTCTYQEEPDSLDDRRQWFGRHGARHPVTVAVMGGQVVGWGSLSPYHPRSAYRNTVENSIYVHHRHHRHGIGTRLLQDLIERARGLGHHAIIALIDAEQAGSVALHARFQFQFAGRLKQAGFKLGRWLDVIHMELIVSAEPERSTEVHEAAVILAMERAALDRWGQGDPSGFLDISAPEVVYFDNHLERRLDGWDALKDLYEKIRGSIRLERYDLLNPKVQVCGEAAVLTYNFIGHAGGSAHGWNCTEVYRQTPAGWRIIQTHWSPTPAVSG